MLPSSSVLNCTEVKSFTGKNYVKTLYFINSYSHYYPSTIIRGGSKLLQRKTTQLRFEGRFGSHGHCAWTLAPLRSLLSLMPNYAMPPIYLLTLFLLFHSHTRLASHPCHLVIHNGVRS